MPRSAAEPALAWWSGRRPAECEPHEAGPSMRTVTLPCLAGARGVRLRPGQASLETVLGTLHSKDAFHAPALAMAGNPDVLITTTVRTQVQAPAQRQQMGNGRPGCGSGEAAPFPSQARAAAGIGTGDPGRRAGLDTHDDHGLRIADAVQRQYRDGRRSRPQESPPAATLLPLSRRPGPMWPETCRR